MSTTRKVFKKWYTLDEAANLINKANNDCLSRFDIIEMLMSRQLTAYCFLHKARITDSPLDIALKEQSGIDSYPTRLLNGIYEIDIDDNADFFFELLENTNTKNEDNEVSSKTSKFKIWLSKDDDASARTYGGIHLPDSSETYFNARQLLIFHSDLESLLSSGRDDISDNKLTVQTESTQSANKKLMMIGSLCHALINGLTGQHMKDSNLIVGELDRRGLNTVSAKTLSRYLSDNAYMQQHDKKI